MVRILVTGGAGYIGSHTCKTLRAEGFEPIVFDNLSTGHRELVKWGPLVEGDILDHAAIDQALKTWKPQAVIHFAGSAYVGESVYEPAKYYRNNVAGSLSLVQCLIEAKIDKFVFSSSCATYGVPQSVPIAEGHPQQPINPYGRTKLIVEHMLDEFDTAYGLRSTCLRYFNACGADPEGETGEIHDPEPHLIPRAMLAALGVIKDFQVYGSDYPNPDGSPIRDYIHVNDLAAATSLRSADYSAARRRRNSILALGAAIPSRKSSRESNESPGVQFPTALARGARAIHRPSLPMEIGHGRF